MRIELTYPPVKRRSRWLRRLLAGTKMTLLFAAYICIIMNIITGAPAWSLVVTASIYMVWTLALSPDMVEYNRISQFIRFLACACMLLGAIGVFMMPGWAISAMSIAGFSGLAISGVLFFTDLERQKQNMLPMLLLIALGLISSVVGLSLWHGEDSWALAVMGAFALALLVACAVTLGGELIRELKRRFHTR